MTSFVTSVASVIKFASIQIESTRHRLLCKIHDASFRRVCVYVNVTSVHCVDSVECLSAIALTPTCPLPLSMCSVWSEYLFAILVLWQLLGTRPRGIPRAWLRSALHRLRLYCLHKKAPLRLHHCARFGYFGVCMRLENYVMSCQMGLHNVYQP